MLAVVSAEIGLSVLWIRGARIALAVSIAISLLFWVLAEGLGGMFTGQGADGGPRAPDGPRRRAPSAPGLARRGGGGDRPTPRLFAP